MEMIVIKYTFQDAKSGMEIRGLGLSRKQDIMSSDCAKTVLESFLGVTASFCEFLVITKITEMNI